MLYIVTFTVVCHRNLVLGTKNKVELWFRYWDHNLFCLQRNQNLNFSLFFLSCCFSPKKLSLCFEKHIQSTNPNKLIYFWENALLESRNLLRYIHNTKYVFLYVFLQQITVGYSLPRKYLNGLTYIQLIHLMIEICRNAWPLQWPPQALEGSRHVYVEWINLWN